MRACRTAIFPFVLMLSAAVSAVGCGGQDSLDDADEQSSASSNGGYDACTKERQYVCVTHSQPSTCAPKAGDQFDVRCAVSKNGKLEWKTLGRNDRVPTFYDPSKHRPLTIVYNPDRPLQKIVERWVPALDGPSDAVHRGGAALARWAEAAMNGAGQGVACSLSTLYVGCLIDRFFDTSADLRAQDPNTFDFFYMWGSAVGDMHLPFMVLSRPPQMRAPALPVNERGTDATGRAAPSPASSGPSKEVVVLPPGAESAPLGDASRPPPVLYLDGTSFTEGELRDFVANGLTPANPIRASSTNAFHTVIIVDTRHPSLRGRVTRDAANVWSVSAGRIESESVSSWLRVSRGSELRGSVNPRYLAWRRHVLQRTMASADRGPLLKYAEDWGDGLLSFPQTEDVITVAIHGSPDGFATAGPARFVNGRRIPGAQTNVTPSQLSRMIDDDLAELARELRARGQGTVADRILDKKMPIQLYACAACGERPDGLPNAAQQLANVSGRRVYAARANMAEVTVGASTPEDWFVMQPFMLDGADDARIWVEFVPRGSR